MTLQTFRNRPGWVSSSADSNSFEHSTCPQLLNCSHWFKPTSEPDSFHNTATCLLCISPTNFIQTLTTESTTKTDNFD